MSLKTPACRHTFWQAIILTLCSLILVCAPVIAAIPTIHAHAKTPFTQQFGFNNQLTDRQVNRQFKPQFQAMLDPLQDDNALAFLFDTA